ncbi:unknown protein [Simkania negevensis Z]|uniref:Uncharacterized protein n=1 Tax=Simkania negevensis (strain ATCC VR-1471 / DSM 27360 / Z) TaxID=331113 RepID=F8L568_SIMNZ|nr:unknown protein [Simkania negevensis Z]
MKISNAYNLSFEFFSPILSNFSLHKQSPFECEICNYLYPVDWIIVGILFL